jgi:hypothetical protein
MTRENLGVGSSRQPDQKLCPRRKAERRIGDERAQRDEAGAGSARRDRFLEGDEIAPAAE